MLKHTTIIAMWAITFTLGSSQHFRVRTVDFCVSLAILYIELYNFTWEVITESSTDFLQMKVIRLRSMEKLLTNRQINVVCPHDVIDAFHVRTLLPPIAVYCKLPLTSLFYFIGYFDQFRYTFSENENENVGLNLSFRDMTLC